ncbi:MAG: type II toxin-antitoxin system RelE/ParE family toxin [Candidatus Hydrothermarchaeota archaeon]|nr:type II toxin-antitoxin system RelE/ParE family toxin [Candidatus Hydrothermarchaeota archaeon]
MFHVYLLKEAEKELNGLPAKIQNRIREQLKALANFPKVRNCVKIVGYEDTFRLRIGDYRALFKVYSDKNVIVVTEIGHRGRIYKKL